MCQSIISAFTLLLLISCLREEAVPIASSFSITVAEDRTAPVAVTLRNDSYGADEYEWIFEGGEPATSRDKNPPTVIFSEAGEHKIRLKVRNAVEERVSEQSIRVDSAMTIDFDYAIELNDIAPGTISIEIESHTICKPCGGR